MKTKSIACFLSEIALNYWADDPDRLPSWAHRHAAHCVFCGATQKQWQHLHEHLASSAPANQQPAPPFLASRIMANLNSGSRAPHRQFFGPTFAVATAFSLILLCGIMVLFQTTKPFDEKTQGTALQGPKTQPSWLELKSFGQANGQVLVDLGDQLEQPLQQELKLVMNDARNAAQALAETFIPTRVRQAWQIRQDVP
jgi:hypothetical protein